MSKGEMNFNCDKCGLCCLNLDKFGPMYARLNDGTGCCKFYDKTTRLCRIYEKRPLICRVEEGYKAFFSDIPYEKYIETTIKGCKKLKEQEAQSNIRNHSSRRI